MDPTVLPLLSTLVAPPSVQSNVVVASGALVVAAAAAAGNATGATVAAILNATVSSGLLEYLLNGSSIHASLPVLADNQAPAQLTSSTSSLTETSSESSAIKSSLNVLTFQTIIISTILLAVIIGTIIGNVLVCVAVCLVRKLRRPCNYLLVSLAISDLCVALLVMPTALLYEVLEEWKFGHVFCDIWVSFDVLSCTASILNLCAISVDRYWAITKPLEYGVKRTPRRMIALIVLVWLVAACISLPPLLILGNEHMTNGHPSCSVCQNFFYQIYATLGSFYIPLAVMLFVYFQIFRAARRIVNEEKRAQTRLDTVVNGSATPEKKLGPCKSVLVNAPHHHKRLRFQLAKERKASTTLGIIMSAFTICWLPFFILALVRPFLGDDHPTLSSVFLWLGYANSLLNPIIYATLNRDFRKPFQEILYFRCSSLNNMMREDFYHSQYGEPGSQRLVITNDGGARESFL
ncbi:5-hydroxytryptamine receptor 1-like [Wyeomyia smithii]|uniref:5-hydroxytryptamine receptor 1-like n=1 Tax=Wyeomyia smithii TaxID=174621 RepID=UPI002467D134|nr:5-hydroxytryptamine receptor 1-like [Wyeomyia smithii]XP_055523716.1 5-hydroxytryptamine receptor 1-like [Wyeomyia smithii]XP_055523725.1 5-hydroxytryptamine receptor 1-like [Wyeomyia smithii]XP_055523732.1 5-hydroxytryptamine receptor 1-like [Wyeomyia smithii]